MKYQLTLGLHYIVFDFVLIVNTVPVATEYFCSKTGSPFSSRTTSPFSSVSLPSFQINSNTTSYVTVVKKIGDIPFVPATIGGY